MSTLEDTVINNADTGDVIMVEGRGFGSQLIRMMTGQQVNHVALIEKNEQQTWVLEMTARHGFSATPIGLWFRRQDREKKYLYWGMAPSSFRGGCKPMRDKLAEIQRNPPHYSFWSLVTVWWAQVTRSKVPHRYVCSTFVREAWAACGYTFDQTPDPGDFMRHSTSVSEIEEYDA